MEQNQTIVKENQEEFDIETELKRWNWGAFSFNIFWGIGHRVYLALLCLIPMASLIVMIILGVKGNQWAWESGKYESFKEFKKCQESWNRAGFVYFWVMVGAFVLWMLIFFSLFMSVAGSSSMRYYY